MSKEESEKEMARAVKSLNSAKLLLENDYHEDSISRAYYAVLHAAKSALILEGISTNSHRAVRKLFSEHLIKTEKIDAKYAKILNMEQDVRFRADYDVLFSAEYEDANECLEDANEFVKEVKKYIE